MLTDRNGAGISGSPDLPARTFHNRPGLAAVPSGRSPAVRPLSSSARLEDRVPDAFGDFAQVVARAGEATVQLPFRGHLAQIIDRDQGRHRTPVDVFEPTLALGGAGRRFGGERAAVPVLAERGADPAVLAFVDEARR